MIITQIVQPVQLSEPFCMQLQFLRKNAACQAQNILGHFYLKKSFRVFFFQYFMITTPIVQPVHLLELVCTQLQILRKNVAFWDQIRLGQNSLEK